jgi:hypothetical protein
MPGIATKAEGLEGQKKPEYFWLIKDLVMLGAGEGRAALRCVDGVDLV